MRILDQKQQPPVSAKCMCCDKPTSFWMGEQTAMIGGEIRNTGHVVGMCEDCPRSNKKVSAKFRKTLEGGG
jgi:hypothetical protein